MAQANPVITGYQAAINLEWQLALQYHLCYCQLKALNLSVADQVKALGEQSQDFVKCLVARIMFLGGDWTYAPEPVETYPTIVKGYQTIVDMETEIINVYRQIWQAAFDAKDLNNLHFVEHETKWHETGGNGQCGHLAWLKQQLRQIDECGGEEVYVAQTMQHGAVENK